jgi:glycosyltransferase involved in cell wall biosynthesis
MSEEARLVAAGEAPRERLYGMPELGALGFDVSISDARFEGRLARLIQWLRSCHLNAIEPATMAAILHSDFVIVKDEFSLVTTAFCRLTRRPLVYLDSTFGVPRRTWRRWAARGSIEMSDLVLVYSKSEARDWARKLRVGEDRFEVVRYGMDVDFYRRGASRAPPPEPSYILSLGRDPGRDYRLLLEAMAGLGYDLKIVTLPYLLGGVDVAQPWIEVRQRVPYAELFSLYAGARAVVVPLKPDVSHPSGLRAMLEGMLLERPVIVTRTPILEEYASDAEVHFVRPGDASDLRDKIRRVVGAEWSSLLPQIERARNRVVDQYNLSRFAEKLASTIRGLGNRAGAKSTKRP